MNLEDLEDETLIERIRSGDAEAMDVLLIRYKDFVRVRTHSYFLIGADRDDIIQEGMIGLYKAILGYDANKESSFRSFADLCIRRQVITAVKNSTRLKHYPLNSSISLNRTVKEEDEDQEMSLMDLLTSQETVNPEDIYIGNEDLYGMEERIIQKLSPMERQVLGLYLSGMDYLRIAKDLDKPPKSIDNALQRIRHKVSEILASQ